MPATATHRYDAILFDFDGVLADTEPIHYACWCEALGVETDWERFQGCVGLSERQTAAYFSRLIDPPQPAEEIWAYFPRKQVLFRERTLASPPISAATRELIRELAGQPLAIVSSASGSELVPILDAAGLSGCFRTFVFGEDVQQPKPSPEPYLLAAERLGAKHPLVVEDSDAGETSGHAAGFEVLRIDAAARTPELVRARLGL